MEFWMIISVFVAVAVSLAMIGKWWDTQYTAAWQRAAQELDLSYYGAQNDLMIRFGRLATLQRGRRQEIRNAIVGGTPELEIAVVDFRYTTGSGKNRHRHTETLCLLHSPTLALPQCSLRPQSRVFDYLGRLFGGQDIDFEEDIEFSRAYVLQGHQEGVIRQLFDAATREWFVSRRVGKLQFEAQGSTLVFHWGRKVSPEKARELIADALELKNLLAARTADGAEAPEAV